MVEKQLLSRPITVVGALALSFTAAGCPGPPFADDGFNDDGYCYYVDCYTSLYTSSYTTDTDPTDPTTTIEPTTDECITFDCCAEYCYYEDDGYYPTTYYTTDPPPTTDPVTSTIPDTDTISTDTVSTETDTDTDTGTGTGTDTGTGTETSGTDTGTSTGTGTGTDTDTDTDTDTSTGGDDAFPPLGVFGDDVIELDLVGTWSLQWSPSGATFDSVITIDDSGNFLWRETSADCSEDTLGTGVVWVEPGQLVMHIETWERQLPWDSLPIMGQEFPPPFRMRMSYALLGTNLMLAAPDRITGPAAYTGRAYLQSMAQGVFIAGTWNGETELMGVVLGEPTAKVIVRDRFIATLDVEPGVVPESTGVVAHDQTWYGVDPPVAGPTVFEGGNWTCLDGCPQPAGATLIDGGHLYAYGPYAGFQRLATFASGRTFRRDIDTDCP